MEECWTKQSDHQSNGPRALCCIFTKWFGWEMYARLAWWSEVSLFCWVVSKFDEKKNKKRPSLNAILHFITFLTFRHNTFTNHFGTLIQANGTSVGCAALLELDEQSVQINFRLVCHYARGINPDMAVYHIGEPGSACLTGTDHTYPALCSENEKFDPNSNIRVYYSEHHSDSNESSAEETES